MIKYLGYNTLGFSIVDYEIPLQGSTGFAVGFKSLFRHFLHRLKLVA